MESVFPHKDTGVHVALILLPGNFGNLNRLFCLTLKLLDLGITGCSPETCGASHEVASLIYQSWLCLSAGPILWLEQKY